MERMYAQTQEAGSSSRIGGAYPTDAPQQPFTLPLVTAVDDVSQVLTRLTAITERLCGSYPKEANSKTGLNPVPNGTFDAVSMAGRHIQEMMREANDLMSRIDANLP